MFDKAHVTGATSSILGEISDSDDDDEVEVVAPQGDEHVTESSSKKARTQGPKKTLKRKAKCINESDKEDKNPFL